MGSGILVAVLLVVIVILLIFFLCTDTKSHHHDHDEHHGVRVGPPIESYRDVNYSYEEDAAFDIDSTVVEVIAHSDVEIAQISNNNYDSQGYMYGPDETGRTRYYILTGAIYFSNIHKKLGWAVAKRLTWPATRETIPFLEFDNKASMSEIAFDGVFSSDRKLSNRSLDQCRLACQNNSDCSEFVSNGTVCVITTDVPFSQYRERWGLAEGFTTGIKRSFYDIVQS